VAAINFHDGPLPRYAGTNATSWALLAGERQHGVTWHLMERRVDAGAVVATGSVEVGARDTAFSLDLKCHEAGVRAFRTVLDALESGRLRTTPQDLHQRT
jgi:methionyl-tRNA formyltransferase